MLLSTVRNNKDGHVGFLKMINRLVRGAYRGDALVRLLLGRITGRPEKHPAPHVLPPSHPPASPRVNVMLSRARHGMVVLGNAATLRAAQLRGAGMWGQVLDILDRDGCVANCLKVSINSHHLRMPACPMMLMHAGFLC